MTPERRGEDSRMMNIEARLMSLENKLEPVIEVWMALSGFVRVLVYVGMFAKWVTILGAGTAAVLYGVRKLL